MTTEGNKQPRLIDMEALLEELTIEHGKRNKTENGKDQEFINTGWQQALSFLIYRIKSGRFNAKEEPKLKVELKVDLIKHTFDGTIIPQGTRFDVEECEDDWTLPGEVLPMYRIMDGENVGMLLHRSYCKVLLQAPEPTEIAQADKEEFHS